LGDVSGAELFSVTVLEPGGKAGASQACYYETRAAKTAQWDRLI